MTTLEVAGQRAINRRLSVPGDKSISHRALLLAALAEGTSTIRNLASGDDVHRTRLAMQAMGAEVSGDTIRGGDLHEPDDTVDAGNSGTGLRLLAGWCAGRPWLTVLTGDASVRSRPMDRVVEPLRRMGASIDGRCGATRAPLVVRGGALTGVEHAPPVASAQVKGAVLLAGLSAEGETVVREALPTRRHTEEMLALCGADVDVEDERGQLLVRVRRSSLQPFELDVPGDPSAAAFWVVGACIVSGSAVVVENVYVGPGRAGFIDVLARMGADVEVRPTGHSTADLHVQASVLHGTTVTAEEVPGLIDEIPVLSLAAACAMGTTTFDGAGELRLKESDRIASTVAMLQAFGARVEGHADGLVVHGRGPGSLRPARVDAAGDHRIAMAAAIGGMAAEGTTVVDGWEAVATSYPGFEEVVWVDR